MKRQYWFSCSLDSDRFAVRGHFLKIHLNNIFYNARREKIEKNRFRKKKEKKEQEEAKINFVKLIFPPIEWGVA